MAEAATARYRPAARRQAIVASSFRVARMLGPERIAVFVAQTPTAPSLRWEVPGFAHPLPSAVERPWQVGADPFGSSGWIVASGQS
jgi:hypothetical protein